MVSDSDNAAPWQLDAVELAARIRTGRLTAREATESTLERRHEVNPALNAVVRTMDDEALASAASAAAQHRGDALGLLARRTGHDEDQHRPASAPDRQRDRLVRGPDADRRRRGYRPSACRGRDLHRSHERAAVLDALVHEERPAQLHPQPAGPGCHAWRIEWRFRGCGGDGHQRDQLGQRHRWVGSLPGIRQRHRRVAADDGAPRLDEHDHAAGARPRWLPVGDAEPTHEDGTRRAHPPAGWMCGLRVHHCLGRCASRSSRRPRAPRCTRRSPRRSKQRAPTSRMQATR